MNNIEAKRLFQTKPIPKFHGIHFEEEASRDIEQKFSRDRK